MTDVAGGIPKVFSGNETCVSCAEGTVHIVGTYSESGQWYCVPFHRSGYIEFWIAWPLVFGIIAFLVQLSILYTIGVGLMAAVSVFFAQLDYAGDTVSSKHALPCAVSKYEVCNAL